MTIKAFRPILCFLILVLPWSTWADVRLPQLVSSGMVLQRDAELTLWGWADPGEEIDIAFRATSLSTTTDASGSWAVTLPPQKAGGPFTLTVQGKNKIVLEDVLVGEVWLGSGQSNMELPLGRVESKFGELISRIDNPMIRQFEVPDVYAFKGPQKDLEGGEWLPATPEHIRDFSAVGYFFAERVHEDQGVPVGFINSALGGSPVESWIREDVLKRFPEPYKEAQRFKNDELIEQIEAEDQARSDKWFTQLQERDRGIQDGEYVWAQPSLNTSNWERIQVPNAWRESGKGLPSGVHWFRKTVEVPKALAGQPATLVLGSVIDADTTFINGKQVGNTTYRYPPRRYSVPEGLLKAGENTIAVRIVGQQDHNGFVLGKTYALEFGEASVPLEGNWRYKTGAEMSNLAPPTFIRWKPVGLYNAMIAPLTPYSIRGVIWYQGESNTGKAQEYHERFSAMIKDWRQQFGQEKMPFIFAQLTNYMEAVEQPSDSGWARLREAQLQTLNLPNTAMAVAIDIGEWNDIHPLDKKTLGERMAAAALHLAYDQDIVYSGPLFESAKVKGNQMVLTFDHVGSGLEARGGELKGFAIAGEDRKFVWAEAEIRGDKIVVWSDKVKNPKAVRYAWGHNPDEANLYNKKGFPASPFRTDSW